MSASRDQLKGDVEPNHLRNALVLCISLPDKSIDHVDARVNTRFVFCLVFCFVFCLALCSVPCAPDGQPRVNSAHLAVSGGRRAGDRFLCPTGEHFRSSYAGLQAPRNLAHRA